MVHKKRLVFNKKYVIMWEKEFVYEKGMNDVNVVWTGLSLLVIMFLLRFMRGVLGADGKAKHQGEKRKKYENKNNHDYFMLTAGMAGKCHEDNYDRAEFLYKDCRGMLEPESVQYRDVLPEYEARVAAYDYLKWLDGGEISEEHKQRWRDRFGGDGPLGDLNDEESLRYLEEYNASQYTGQETVKAAIENAGQSETHELHEVDYYA